MKASKLMCRKVLLAPFSVESIILYHKLAREGVNVVAFLDRDTELHTSSYCDTVIIPYARFAVEKCIVIMAKSPFEDAVYSQLIDVGYSDEEIIRDIALSCSEADIQNDIDYAALPRIKRGTPLAQIMKRRLVRDKVANGLVIESLQLIVTTRCTLKCKNCITLIDYFRPQDQRDMDVELTIKSFNTLMTHVDFVENLLPIGGEPFLYKPLDALLRHLTESPYSSKIGTIYVITNSTVLPKESTMKIIGAHRDKFYFCLSNFGVLSNKLFELTKLLNNYGCRYYVRDDKSWYKINRHKIPAQELKMEDIAKKCAQCVCRTGGALRVVENKVFSCQFEAFATECRIIPYDERNFLDISTNEISKEILRKFERDIHPGSAYCESPCVSNSAINIPIPIAEQTNLTDCIRFE